MHCVAAQIFIPSHFSTRCICRVSELWERQRARQPYSDTSAPRVDCEPVLIGENYEMPSRHLECPGTLSLVALSLLFVEDQTCDYLSPCPLQCGLEQIGMSINRFDSMQISLTFASHLSPFLFLSLMGQVTPCNPMAVRILSHPSPLPMAKNRSDSPFSPDELSFLAESDVAARVNGSPLLSL